MHVTLHHAMLAVHASKNAQYTSFSSAEMMCTADLQ
jgi:hypothetical protein